MARWNGGPWGFSKGKRGAHRSRGRRAPRWDGKGLSVTDASVMDKREKTMSDFSVKSTVWAKWVCLGSGNQPTGVGRHGAQFVMKCESRTRAAANRQGRQVTTATPAMLDLRVTGVTDEGCADTISAKSLCSMALATSSAQGCLVVFHLQAPESQGCIAQDWALYRWHVKALRLRRLFSFAVTENATEI